MNKRQAKKRRRRELWINWCGEVFKMPFLMKWKEVKFHNKLNRATGRKRG